MHLCMLKGCHRPIKVKALLLCNAHSIRFYRDGMEGLADDFLRRCTKLLSRAEENDALERARSIVISNTNTNTHTNSPPPTEQGAPKKICKLKNFPTAFVFTERHFELGRAAGLMTEKELSEEFEAFRDYCSANGKRYVNYTAAFNTRLQNCKKFGRSEHVKKPGIVDPITGINSRTGKFDGVGYHLANLKEDLKRRGHGDVHKDGD
jgi:hypothetical protein